ncbi:hypothetical protein [Cupriavidus metallidurans]|uniref:hypothetical protein n=1 Tax=Cupriavidus metallidurans TaxID=119219 RepID=UPI0004930D69|nr:hypothetical protein [Cupriavidus metallidurans]QGS33276.1 hypothetical protein FOB83_31505 [Cupriavidus metallidurans]
MSVKEAIEFIKLRGGFNSYRALAEAAGVDLRRVDNAVGRGSALTATEEIALGSAAGMKPLEAIKLLETAYNPANESMYSKLQKLFKPARRAMTLRFA